MLYHFEEGGEVEEEGGVKEKVEEKGGGVEEGKEWGRRWGGVKEEKEAEE